MIIGLCGRAGHGKDTFARFMRERNSNFDTHSFAAKLKSICQKVFGLTQNQVETPEGKAQLFKTPIKIDEFLPQLRLETGLALTPLNLIADSPRRLLQFVGSDYVRLIDADYWCRPVLSLIRSAPYRHHIVTDVRFANEASEIREAGGLIIKINRLLLSANDTEPKHVSESVAFDIDSEIAVRENNFTLHSILGHLSTVDEMTFTRALISCDFRQWIFWGPVLSAYYGPVFSEAAKNTAEKFSKETTNA